MDKSVHTRDYQVVLEMLSSLRKASGITQVALAEELGTTQSFVSKIERGELRLDILQLRRLCHALGMPLAAFVAELDKHLSAGEEKERDRSRRAKK